MRTFEFAALMLLPLVVVSCYTQGGHPLPPPGPPVPAPPPPAAAPPPQVVRSTHPSLVGLRFVVTFWRADGVRREVDSVNANRAVDDLARMGLGSRNASGLPSGPPAGILEEARAAAAALAKTPDAGDVLLYGWAIPGPEVQVRIAAVELHQQKDIDNFGNKGPTALMDELILKTLEQTLAGVEAYFGRPPPPGAPPAGPSAPPPPRG